MRSKNYLLLIIIILAAILRLWNISDNPPGLTWDEAALGYNAYSLLQTGRDEYGTLLPLTLKSFGDYKPALYAYLDIPFVAIVGLNELAVRLPSVLFGILGVWAVYLLVDLLFKNKWLSLSSAFFLAISPWAIQYSRPAFEANVALTFNIFAVYFFVKGLDRHKFFIFSALLFGLSILTYQSSKLFVPLIILGLLFVYWKDYSFKALRISMIVLGLFFALVLGTVFMGQTNRLATVSFFAYQRSQTEVNLIAKEDGMSINSFGFQALHGEWWAYTKGLVERYTIYFSPKMLFVDGDYQQRERVPDLGLLYYFSVLLIPLGIIYLIKRGDKASKLILVWLLLAPVPAVLSRDLITTLRALNMLVPYEIIEAMGFWWLMSLLIKRSKNWFFVGLSITSVLICLNLFIYLDRYFIHAPIEYSKYWLYGYKQTLTGLNTQKNNYSKVVVTDTYGQPYIYYLFYNKISPAYYQKQAKLDQPTADVGNVRNIDNIEFRHIFWPTERGDKNELFIGTKEELPDQDIIPFKDYKILKDTNFLDGEFALREVESEK